MELRQLETFCAVARSGGFTLAAEQLGLTQPTVSYQIASLEDELGTKLFDRAGRVVTITRSGEILHRYAVKVLGLTSEAEQSIRKLKGLLWGEIKTGASTIPGEYILPGILQQFREDHPGIEIAMVVDDTMGIVKRVLNDEIEIGVVGATEKGDKLTFTKFFSDRLVLIAPAECTWFTGGSATLEELRRAQFVMREDGSGTRTAMRQKLKEIEFSIDSLDVAMTLGSTEAVKRAVESGAGVSIVSERAVRNEVKLGLIKEMKVEGLEMTRDFFIVNRKRKALSPAAQALQQFLEQAV